jgi:hypothetical protein
MFGALVEGAEAILAVLVSCIGIDKAVRRERVEEEYDWKFTAKELLACSNRCQSRQK